MDGCVKVRKVEEEDVEVVEEEECDAGTGLWY
jgi:hypothetical protein